ncbi:MAG: SDR family oxidoreductase, partial [Planctomycetales bacterium]
MTSPSKSARLAKYGPWALVTGASAGIGEEFARQLAAEGFNLVLTARRKHRLIALAKNLESRFNIKTRIVVVDLIEPGALDAIHALTRDIVVGLLINNAGVENHGPFVTQDLVSETKLLQLNIVTPMQLAHHFARQMQQRGRGGILFVSSVGGYGAWPYLANYAASKAYLLTLGESLHYELAKQGVDVTVLSPGLTDTAMADNIGSNVDLSRFPMRTMQPQKVVRKGLKSLGKKPSVIPGIWNNV